MDISIFSLWMSKWRLKGIKCSEPHQSRRAALMSHDRNQDGFCEREGILPCSYFWLQEERAIRNVDEQMCSFIITSFLDLLMLSRHGRIP